MERQDLFPTLLQACIIAWIVFVFVMYHWQYLELSRMFVEVYAQRYVPFLVPILNKVIP